VCVCVGVHGRYWVPWFFAWLFSLYALHILRSEYEAVAQLRLDYLADQKRSPQQYTVSVTKQYTLLVARNSAL